MSSFEQKLKQWTINLKLPNISATLTDIRDSLRRPSRDIDLQALHIFSKVVLPAYCSAENPTSDNDLLEMITYLWTFSQNDRFKHFLTQLYSTLRGMPTTKATCARIKMLTPMLHSRNLDQIDIQQVYTNINSNIFYMFYTAKEQLGNDLSTVLFKNANEVLKRQRSASLLSFLEAFAAWFNKKTQLLLVMLSVDPEKTQTLLESAASLFKRGEEQVSVKFRDQFWGIVQILVRFESKFKGTRLVETVVGSVQQSALFEQDPPMAASVALFYETLLFKKQPLDEQSFGQLTKAVNAFLKNVDNAEFPASVITLIVFQLYEKMHKSDPTLTEPVCAELMTAIDGLMRWVYKYWTSGVRAELHMPICQECGQAKDHILLQMAAAIALTPIQQHFRNHTITKRLFDPFLSIVKINVLTLDRLKCTLAARLKVFWLNTWWNLAKGYKQTLHSMRPQFLEIFRLIQAKRHTYAPNTFSDTALLRLYELVYNADVCGDLPADDPVWGSTIDLMCTQIVVEERKYAPRSVVVLFGLQRRNARFKDLNLHQLIERPEFHDFGVNNVRRRMDRISLIELQMWVIYMHCPDQLTTLVDLFDYVWQDRPENAAKLAKLIQYFDEAQFQRLAPDRVERLKQMCATNPPTNAEDTFQVSLSLGYLNYNVYVAEHELVKRAGRAANPTDKAMLQKDLLPFIDQINMEQECKLLRLLDEVLGHFTVMTRLLVTKDNLFELIVSPSKLMRCLDNLSLFYQLRYVEDKAMQAKCLVYVLAKRRAHLNAQLSCAALFIENPLLYEAVVATAIGFKMPRTVCAFLDANKVLTDAIHQPQPDRTKTTLAVEVRMKLAVYYAAIGVYDRVEQLVTGGRDIILRYENDTDAKSFVWYMKVHFYHALYLITFKHRMRWLVSLHAVTQYVLAMFKQMNEAPTQDYLTQPTVFMQKMIPEVLEFLATQKGVTDANDAFLNMLIKYAIRQGYGLRTAQLFAMSSKLALDREGMDECEVKLAYVDKVLMFYTNANLSEKSSYPVAGIDPPSTPIAMSPLADDVFTPIEPIRRDSGAPNGREFITSIAGNTKQQQLRQMTADQPPQRRLSKYIIDHPDACDCGFCRYPQFRLVSFQTGCIYTRLLHMTGAHDISDKLYAKYYKCWSVIRERVKTQRIMSATLAQAFGQFSAQFMLHYSQSFVHSKRLDEAKAKLELAHRIFRTDVPARNDGFLQEVECQSENVKLMMAGVGNEEASMSKFLAHTYEEYLKRTRQHKTPAKPQLLTRPLSKSTVKKAPNRDSFSFLISTEVVATSSQVTANDIFNDSSSIPERHKKKRVISKTPKAGPANSKTPVTMLRRKLDATNTSAKPTSPVTIGKLTKVKVHGETVKKLQFADEAKADDGSTPKTPKCEVKKSLLAIALEKKRQEIDVMKGAQAIPKGGSSPENGSTPVKPLMAKTPKTATKKRLLGSAMGKKKQEMETKRTPQTIQHPVSPFKDGSTPIKPLGTKVSTRKRLPASTLEKKYLNIETLTSKVHHGSDDDSTPIKQLMAKTPKIAAQRNGTLKKTRQNELESKKNLFSTPKPTRFDNEVIDASPEIIAKTPRLRAAQMKSKTPMPIIILDDSDDDAKENAEPTIIRKLRTTRTAKAVEVTPKRPNSTRRR